MHTRKYADNLRTALSIDLLFFFEVIPPPLSHSFCFATRITFWGNMCCPSIPEDFSYQFLSHCFTSSITTFSVLLIKSDWSTADLIPDASIDAGLSRKKIICHYLLFTFHFFFHSSSSLTHTRRCGHRLLRENYWVHALLLGRRN